MKSNPPAISGKSDLMAWEPLGISDPSEEGYVDMKVSTFNTNNKSIISSTNMTSMFFLLMFTSHYELGSGFNNILPSSIVYKRSSSLIVPVIPFTKSTIRRHVLSTGRRRKVQTMGKTKRGKHFDFSLYTSYHSSLSNNSINESNDSSDNHFEDDLNTVNQHSTIRATEELENLQLINARLQEENDQLKRELKSQQQHNSYYASRRPTIVLESFEPGGNGKVLLNDRMNPEQQHGLDSSSPPEMEISFMAQDQQQWCDEVEADSEECPVEPGVLFQDAVRDRAYWLVGLLAAQSCSGFILARNEELLQNHPEIIFFLTMLIGAGGNAGNQASVRVIRGLALGSLNEKTRNQFLTRELKMAFALSAILSVAGFLRASLFQTPFPETVAVTASLYVIVFCSICLGAVLPLGLRRIGVDPAHSSTTIQVLMDILGVVLTVIISGLLLDTSMGKFLIDHLL